MLSPRLDHVILRKFVLACDGPRQRSRFEKIRVKNQKKLAKMIRFPLTYKYCRLIPKETALDKVYFNKVNPAFLGSKPSGQTTDLSYFAPVQLTPVKLLRLKDAPLKFAFVKSAPWKFALV